MISTSAFREPTVPRSIEHSQANGIRDGRIYKEQLQKGRLWRIAKGIQALALTILTFGIGLIFKRSRIYIFSLYRQAYTGLERKNEEKSQEVASRVLREQELVRAHPGQGISSASKNLNSTSELALSPDVLVSKANQSLKEELEKNQPISAHKYALFKVADTVYIPQNCSFSLKETLEKLCVECPNLKVISFTCPAIVKTESDSIAYTNLKNVLNDLLQDVEYLRRMQIQVFNLPKDVFSVLDVDQVVRLDSILIKQSVEEAQSLFEELIKKSLKFNQADSKMFDKLLGIFRKMSLASLQIHVKTVASHPLLPFHRKSTALAELSLEQLKSFIPTVTDQQLLGSILNRALIDGETEKGQARFILLTTRLLELINSDEKALYEFYKRFGSVCGKSIMELITLDHLKLLRQAMNKHFLEDFNLTTFRIVSQLIISDREDKFAALSYFISSLSDADHNQILEKSQQYKVGKERQNICIAMYLHQFKNCLKESEKDKARLVLQKIGSLSGKEQEIFACQLAKICEFSEISIILEHFVKDSSKDVLIVHFMREILKSEHTDKISTAFQFFWPLSSKLNEGESDILSQIFSAISEKGALKVLAVTIQETYCKKYFSRFLFSLPVARQDYVLKNGLNGVQGNAFKFLHTVTCFHQYIQCLSNPDTTSTDLTSILSKMNSLSDKEVEKFGKYLAGKIRKGDISLEKIPLILESFTNAPHKQALTVRFMTLILESNNEKLINRVIPEFWRLSQRLNESEPSCLEQFVNLIPTEFIRKVKEHIKDSELRVSFIRSYLEIKTRLNRKLQEQANVASIT